MKLKQQKRFNQLPEKTQKQLSAFATRELTEFVLDRMGKDLDAILLYTLYRQFGFGKHKLRRVYDGVFEAKKELKEQWLGNDKEIVDDAKRVLKTIGVDIELWDTMKREWLDGGYKNDEVWNSVGRKEL